MKFIFQSKRLQLPKNEWAKIAVLFLFVIFPLIFFYSLVLQWTFGFVYGIARMIYENEKETMDLLKVFLQFIFIGIGVTIGSKYFYPDK